MKYTHYYLYEKILVIIFVDLPLEKQKDGSIDVVRLANALTKMNTK